MPSVYTALSDNNKLGTRAGLRVNMWQRTNFPVQVGSTIPPISSNAGIMSFLSAQRPGQDTGLAGVLGTMNLAPLRPPTSSYYHTSWYQPFK